MPDGPESTPLDFFVSYTDADVGWAEWIAWQLEAAGYSVCLQAWDHKPGAFVVAQIDEAIRRTRRTIAVLSPAYMRSQFAVMEWWTVVHGHVAGGEPKLVPVRIADFAPDGVIGAIQRIDLVGLDEDEARTRLLAGVRPGRLDPPQQPTYPGAPTAPGAPSYPPDLPDMPPAASAVAPTVDARGRDSVDGPWAALVFRGELWLIEASERALNFRPFGRSDERGLPALLERPVGAMALTETGSYLAVMGSCSLCTVPVTSRGRLGEWLPAVEDLPETSRLLAVRDLERGGVEAAIAEDQATVAVTPRRLVPLRRGLSRVTAAAAAALGGAFVLVDSGGSVVLGSSAVQPPDGWLDVDCARGGDVQLWAGLRREGSSTVVYVDRFDGQARDSRRFALDDACSIRVARPIGGGGPDQLIVRSGGELHRWAWEDLGHVATPRRRPAAEMSRRQSLTRMTVRTDLSRPTRRSR